MRCAILWLCCSIASATLLIYSQPSNLHPTGFGTFDVNGVGSFNPKTKVGGRLLAPPRVTSLLVSSQGYAIVFGQFNWAQGTEIYNLAVTDIATGSIQPLDGPSVWGSGVEAACWRSEVSGRFFVVGQINGFDTAPQSRLQGVAACSVSNGCGAVTLGLSQMPQSLRFASISYQARTDTLYVMYRATALTTSQLTGAERVDTLLGIFRDNSWTYFSLFKNENLEGHALRVLPLFESVFVNLAPQENPDRFLASIFCPADNSAVPSLVELTGAYDYCWSKMASPAVRNKTFTVATEEALYSLQLDTGRIWKMTSSSSVGVDVTANIGTFRTSIDQRMSLFTSDDSLFALIFQQGATPVLRLGANGVWEHLFDIEDPQCIDHGDSIFASHPPVAASGDGMRILWTCPFISNERFVGFDSNVTAYTADLRELPAVPKAIFSTPFYRAGVLDDMQAVGSAVWMRGNFQAVSPLISPDDLFPAADGMALWFPGTGKWSAVSGFDDATSFSLVTLTNSKNNLWVPFAKTERSFSLACYDGIRDHWQFFHPASPDNELFAHLNVSLAPSGGHSTMCSYKDDLWMTWLLVDKSGHTMGALVKVPNPLKNAISPLMLEWSVVSILRNPVDDTACWDLNTCWADTFATTLVFADRIWIVGSFTFEMPQGHWIRAVASFDPESGEHRPVSQSVDEYVFATTAAVGRFDEGVEEALWVGGTIKTIPGLLAAQGAMNVASLDANGNWTATTKALLAPPTRLNAQRLFFAGRNVMVVLSQDWRTGYELVAAGMNIFRNGMTFPDPAVQSMWYDVMQATEIQVDTVTSVWALIVLVSVTLLLMAAVSILIPCIWMRWAGPSAAGGFRYISLPSYQDHGVDTNLGALLHDDSIRKLDAADVEMGSKLGSGGQATVFRARYLGRDIAAKALTGFDASQFSRFVREIKLTATIQHKNIISFVGVLVEEQSLYLCTEYLETDLAKVIPVLTLAQQVGVTQDVACGMAYLHSYSPVILHRDLKPQNILISTTTGRAKVADFGVSRIVATKMTNDSGTFLYQAPEMFQKSSHYGPASDVYSFGLLVLEVFSREPPYSSATTTSAFLFEFVDAVRSQRLLPNVHGLPPACPVRSVILDCIQWEPSSRPSFAAVVRALEKDRHDED